MNKLTPEVDLQGAPSNFLSEKRAVGQIISGICAWTPHYVQLVSSQCTATYLRSNIHVTYIANECEVFTLANDCQYKKQMINRNNLQFLENKVYWKTLQKTNKIGTTSFLKVINLKYKFFIITDIFNN